jgi:hypothetical protein
MKILLVTNKAEREGKIMARIAQWIRHFMPAASVLTLNYCAADALSQSLAFNPDVLLMFPLTAKGNSRFPVLVKACCGSTIVTLETEGGTGYDTRPSYIKQFVGYDEFDERLVDYALYWGWHDAQHIGGMFLKECKISDASRNVIFGYAPYEVYFSKELQREEASKLPHDIRARLAGFADSERLLFVTGFHTADYSRQDCINAADLFDTSRDYSKELEAVLLRVDREKRRRDAWIGKIVALAQAHPHIQFIVKHHPIEDVLFKRTGTDHYGIFSQYPNILSIYDSNVNTYQLLSRSKALVHYGSTVVAETYLQRRRSVFVYCNELHGDYLELYRQSCDPKGWPSTHATTIDALHTAVDAILAEGELDCDPPSGAARVLHDFFNIKDPARYTPSRGIAEFLLAVGGAAQPLAPGDGSALVYIEHAFDMILDAMLRNALELLRDKSASGVGKVRGLLGALAQMPLPDHCRTRLKDTAAHLFQACTQAAEAEAGASPDASLRSLTSAKEFLSLFRTLN